MNAKEFMLGTLNNGQLRVQVPFVVKSSTDGDYRVAEIEAIDSFGYGKTQSEAVADLQYAVTGLYFVLEAEEKRLVPDLTAIWHKLQKHVRRTIEH